MCLQNKEAKHSGLPDKRPTDVLNDEKTCCFPTNQENWPNVFPYKALYWANVLAIVPTLGQFFWFVGFVVHSIYHASD